MSIHEWITTGSVSDAIAKKRGLKELVRCKDCTNSSLDSVSYPEYWCSAHSEYHKGEWYCADGERMDSVGG